MTNYAEMNCPPRAVRPFYLELKALGLDLSILEDRSDPTGYLLMVLGARSLSPSDADRIRRRAEELKPGLLRVLWAKWDPDLCAIREEGGTA